MPDQLIINILGPHSVKALSALTATISEHNCNILDSRHALYGTDFSITMIVAGTQSGITAVELALSQQCVSHDLLCMMKRTSGHKKQNIENIVNLKFCGIDKPGLIYQVLHFLSEQNVTVNAIRQKTWVDDSQEKLECKMILLASSSLDLRLFDQTLIALLDKLGLHGRISHNINKEYHEYIESW